MNSLCSNLQSMRSQIELYKVQHNDIPPSLDDFENQMVYATNIGGGIDGTGSKVRGGDYQYGPYLERVPNNPFNNENGVGDAAGDGIGWIYDEDSGEIRAAAGPADMDEADLARL